MRTVDKESITKAFVDYCGEQTDPRLKFVLESLAGHLHGFIRETNLTHDEWRKALELLYEAGKISTPQRNEFILFSDLLGLSSLVDLVNSPDGATPSSVLGPFHVTGAPSVPVGADLIGDDEGQVVVFGGRVLDENGEPIEGAELEIWQTAANGLYSNQDEAQSEYNLRAHMVTARDGRYLFSTVRPAPYPVPDDGPAGELLHATGRHPWRPSHLHFIVTAAGHRTLVTETFPSDDPYLDEDPVFGVREQLVLEFTQRTKLDELPAELEIRDRLSTPYLAVDFDFVLAKQASGKDT
jgi:protocatechuate 3,4-dioxygenase beta subunit